MGLLRGEKFFFNYFRKWLAPLGINHRRMVLPGVRSDEEFKEILQRERARTDRSGRPFSMVVLCPPLDGARSRRIIRVLSRRLRCTDQAGWFCGGLALLLPETSPQGAWKLVEDLRKLLGRSFQEIPFDVFAYPVEGIGVKDERVEGRGRQLA
jgi:hypothetical protein